MSMYELPVSITTEEGIEYTIRNKGDYRMVLDCLEALDDMDLKPLERLYAGLIIFYEKFDSVEDILADENVEQLLSKMFLFFNLNKQEDKKDNRPKLIDWNADSALIVSAINKVAGKEIRSEEYLHWWTFISYYMGIGESSLTTVVTIREKIAKNKKLEKYEKEFRANNPEYFTVDLRTHEQKANDEWAMSVWNSGR